MKKYIFIILILFSSSLLFSYMYFSSKPLKIAKEESVKKVSIDNSTSLNTSSIESNVNDQILSSKDKPKHVYAILGDSSALTKNQKEAMNIWRNDAENLSKKNSENLFINGNTDTKTLCLTFDDGPDNIIMPKILSLLKSEGVKASFFLIGKNVYENRAVVKSAYDDGNLILSHSYTHREMTKLSDAEINNELNKSQNAIYNIIGKRPMIIRPPYGSVTERELSLISSSGYKAVLWSIDTLDWSKKDKYSISGNVLNNIRPGDIVLMHCNSDKEATYEALTIVIRTLKERGYSFLTLDEMLNIKAYE